MERVKKTLQKNLNGIKKIYQLSRDVYDATYLRKAANNNGFTLSAIESNYWKTFEKSQFNSIPAISIIQIKIMKINEVARTCVDPYGWWPFSQQRIFEFASVYPSLTTANKSAIGAS